MQGLSFSLFLDVQADQKAIFLTLEGAPLYDLLSSLASPKQCERDEALQRNLLAEANLKLQMVIDRATSAEASLKIL
ncbi:hypothetical protein DOY81_007927 [Sarcophaga bullata]|nr:hypothetical protein DOY81_007927 [Sarcophaga bullata]